MFDSLWPHRLQHAWLPCPSLSSGVCSNSYPLSQWCHPIISSSVTPFSFCPQSFKHQGLFWWVSSSHQVAKYWRFSINTSPCNEYSGLISFRVEWSDFLALQWTLKSLLQQYSLKAAILCYSACMVQLPHPYMTTGKTIALTIRTFVNKVMSLLCNTLSRFVMGFPGGSGGKESTYNAGDLDLTSGLGRCSGEGNCYPLEHFWPGEFHGQRSLAVYSPWGHRVRHDWATFMSLGLLLLFFQGASIF